MKNGFLTREIAAEDLTVLSEPHGGRLFYYPRETDHAKCIQEATVESYRVQAYRDEAQKELAQWVRFSNEDARKHRDGLTTGEYGNYRFLRMVCAAVHGPRRCGGRAFQEQGIDIAAKWAAEGGGWMVITSGGRGVEDLVETGRRFECTALLARAQHLPSPHDSGPGRGKGPEGNRIEPRDGCDPAIRPASGIP